MLTRTLEFLQHRGYHPWQEREGFTRVMSLARVGSWLLSLGVSVATAIVMVATEPRMAIVWDEAYTLGREERLRQWFQALADPAWLAVDWQPPAPGSELMLPDAVPAPRPQLAT